VVQRPAQDSCGKVVDRIFDTQAVFVGVSSLENGPLSSKHKDDKANDHILFGIGRKAMGTTLFPCPRRTVLVMLPSEA
jgi:hypothetical protein